MDDTKKGHPLRGTIGLSAALSTPFTEAGEVDWNRLASHAENLLSRGMKVVTAFGTTGEGVSVPIGTRAELYDHMSANNIAPSSLVECIYGPAAADAGSRARHAFEAGCAAILLTPPFYFGDLGEEGLYRWFSQTIEAGGPKARNVILYHIPQITGVRIELGLLARLRKAFGDVIGGVKDSGGDWSYTEPLVRQHKDLAILVGNEGHLAPAVRLGASGAISGLANFAPELVGTLVSGIDDRRIFPILDAVLALPVQAAIKAYMADTIDNAWRRMAPPLDPMSPAQSAALTATIKAALAGLGTENHAIATQSGGA